MEYYIIYDAQNLIHHISQSKNFAVDQEALGLSYTHWACKISGDLLVVPGDTWVEERTNEKVRENAYHMDTIHLVIQAGEEIEKGKSKLEARANLEIEKTKIKNRYPD